MTAEQVQELLQASHIREIQFPTWLYNVVLVPKSTGKWRMCIDFRDLNKVCLKDCYPLPQIDQLVDSTSGGHIPTDDGQCILRADREECGVWCEVEPGEVCVRDQKWKFFGVHGDGEGNGGEPGKRYSKRHRCLDGGKECERAFKELNEHLAQLPVLVKPDPGERLWVYLSTIEQAVSTVLIKEEKGDQRPVYYVSHALKGPKTRYSDIEKMALALVITARKLRPYFLYHPITVLTNSSLGRVMTHTDILGRMVNWTVELGEYDIEYQSMTMIKAQTLSDFLTKAVSLGQGEV
ncbi:uncharacterized protein [Henckelia pumila]|uniref:uncharacterized protein n=1 Tax=Henckelia pumila TaxID=405737 RepID=UPI003C6DF10D